MNAAVAAYYYVRVIMAMYLRTSLAAPAPTPRAHPALVAAVICLVVTVVFGIYPKPLQEACWRARSRPSAGVAGFARIRRLGRAEFWRIQRPAIP